MASRELSADEVGLPALAATPNRAPDIFAFSSHARAKEALAFAVGIEERGFNVFVVGEDRSGRMTATLEFLNATVADRPPPHDWIYLANFREPHRPIPFRLPAGTGRRLRDAMAALVPQLREALGAAFGSDDNQFRMQAESARLRAEIGSRMEALRAEARAAGLDIVQTEQGMAVVRAEQGDPAQSGNGLEEAARAISEKLGELNRWAVRAQAEATDRVQTIGREIATGVVEVLVGALARDFGSTAELAGWIGELQEDILDGLHRFQARPEPILGQDQPERRYSVNLLVDRADAKHPPVIVEPTPTYENLFGRVEYRQVGGILETDFTLLRSGALHRANGGILVVRAEALAAQPAAWQFMKAALRDDVVRIEELHRATTPPIAGAPSPIGIPLSVKVVIVGAPRWYYTFFSADPEFQTYFKVKAEIDPDMPATPANLANYGALIENIAAAHTGTICEPRAISRLLGTAARWAGDRKRLSSRFELVEDVLSEAIRIADDQGPRCVTEAHVAVAVANRRSRNARIEDRWQEHIARGAVLIDTGGAVIGQVNALTVRDVGDHTFGSPSRVTARASVGRLGVVNIEREAELGGPIQQKGAMVLQGFLTGHFARRIPLSFTCSITFEQSYGGVEGDSASLAELVAILSDLAGLPVRQDLAITGSVNQRGQAQAIGGVTAKVEGFFRTCLEAGELTGSQGVVIPAANEENLVLDDAVTEAVRAGRFHIWSVAQVDQAVELFLGVPAGVAAADGLYPADTVYGRVALTLEAFDRIISDRERHRI